MSSLPITWEWDCLVETTLVILPSDLLLEADATPESLAGGPATIWADGGMGIGPKRAEEILSVARVVEGNHHGGVRYRGGCHWYEKPLGGHKGSPHDVGDILPYRMRHTRLPR